jgi:hypothetical protein
MGVMKFRLPSNEPALQGADFRKAYITGLDRTPSRLGIELRNGVMNCVRDSMESGRLFVPWLIPGYGMPIVGTATLAERPAPYVLAVELARGKLNDIRNQLADWTLMGLRATVDLEKALAEAQHAFIRAATSTDRPDVSLEAAQASLRAASRAGDLLMDTYTSQILQSRLLASARLPTRLACMLDVASQKLPSSVDWPATLNACHVAVTWKQIAPTEGQYAWDVFDSLLAWGKSQGMAIEAGPLVDFRQGALPDWIWLWQGDGETISGLVAEFVRQVVARYKGKVPLWHLIHRMASGEILGLSEEDQIRIAARAIQVARQTDPSAQLTIGVDRPWAEWMGSSHFQLGPLHLCDYLLRADIGLAGVAIEIAPGYSPPGSHLRDLFEFSKLLDLYSLLNVPLHVWMAIPSGVGVDPAADQQIQIQTAQWAAPPNEEVQAAWGARWAALAVAKPFVRTLSWIAASDALPHLYPHAGLVRPDQTAKTLAGWFRMLRKETLH